MLMPRESIYTHYAPAVIPGHDTGALTYWFIFSAGRLLIEQAEGNVRIPQAVSVEELGITPIRSHYLGTWQEIPCYAVEAAPGLEDPAGRSFQGLRSLYGAMSEGLFHLAGRAVQIIAWADTHQYCGKCGGKTVSVEHEHAMKCPACGTSSYPRIAPAVITAILKGNQILLAHARHFQGNMYSLIAGFVEPGETLEDCVQREIREEVGLKVTNIRYFGSQQWPFPHSLMIGFIADYESGEIAVDGEEIVAAEWFDADHLPVIPSHVSIARKIIDWYVSEHSEDKGSSLA
jgi:NAD+ diphosphatase